MSRLSVFCSSLIFAGLLCLSVFTTASAQSDNSTIRVKPVADFSITGDGSGTAWNSTTWIDLQASSPDSRKTRLKILYSSTGLYFLYDNEDKVITSTKNEDFDKLWLEDVVEVFLWPDTTHTIYFEYEISPLNHELAILVPNINGKFLGWRPWLYTDSRRTRHLTTIVKEPGEKGAVITKWIAEFFIPYELLKPLANVPPRKGSQWRANMYRVDYDHGKTTEWSWKKVQKSFHEYTKFGVLVFE